MANSTDMWENTSRLHFFITYSNDGDRQGNAFAHDMFVGPTNLSRWDSFVGTWVRAMRHPRYLTVNGRPVFKVLIPDNFLGWQCGSNTTLADSLLQRLRSAAAVAGVGDPIIGGGWHNPSVPIPAVPPEPRPVQAGYMHYPKTYINCSGGCTLGHYPNVTEAGPCQSICNATFGCTAITINSSSGCIINNDDGPGAPR